jgi:hypothetical protein
MMTGIEGGPRHCAASEGESPEFDHFKDVKERLQSLNEALRREENLGGGGLTEAGIALERRADELNREMFRVAHEILADGTDSPEAITAKAKVALFYAEADSDDIVHAAAQALARSVLKWLSMHKG